MSVTVTVIVAVPVWPGEGVMVKVRLRPPPATTRLASGTRDWSDDVADAVQVPASLLTLPTFSGIGPVDVFSTICSSARFKVAARYTYRPWKSSPSAEAGWQP